MRLRAALCVVLLFGARSAAADPFTLQFSEGGFGLVDASWGAHFARLVDGLTGLHSPTFDGQVDTTVAFNGGPRLLKFETFLDDEGSVYKSVATYNGASFKGESHWMAADGSLVSGAFDVGVHQLTFEVHENPSGEFAFGDVFLTLGGGWLDRDLIELTGAPGHRVRNGTYWMSMDIVEPPFEELGDDWARTGDWNGSKLELAVPEPAASSLFSIVALGLVARIRRRTISR